jgi:hypothetical protein
MVMPRSRRLKRHCCLTRVAQMSGQRLPVTAVHASWRTVRSSAPESTTSCDDAPNAFANTTVSDQDISTRGYPVTWLTWTWCLGIMGPKRCARLMLTPVPVRHEQISPDEARHAAGNGRTRFSDSPSSGQRFVDKASQLPSGSICCGRASVRSVGRRVHLNYCLRGGFRT